MIKVSVENPQIARLLAAAIEAEEAWRNWSKILDAAYIGEECRTLKTWIRHARNAAGDQRTEAIESLLLELGIEPESFPRESLQSSGTARVRPVPSVEQFIPVEDGTYLSHAVFCCGFEEEGV